MIRRIKFLVASAAIVLFVGCDSELFAPSTAPVSGTITMDGSPLAGAKILFVPLDTKNGRGRGDHISSGVTNAAGEYSIKTDDGKSGAARGIHLVLISKRKPPDPVSEKPAFDNPETPSIPKPIVEAVQADSISPLIQFSFPWMAAGQDEKLEIVPVQYNRESTLSAIVEKGGTKKLDFDLSSANKRP